MRGLVSTVVAGSMLFSSVAFAAPHSPLPSGKAAGVHDAALLGPSLFVVLLGSAVLVTGLALTVSNSGGKNNVTTPTTTSTSTTALP